MADARALRQLGLILAGAAAVVCLTAAPTVSASSDGSTTAPTNWPQISTSR
jgi:hypothetical protein